MADVHPEFAPEFDGSERQRWPMSRSTVGSDDAPDLVLQLIHEDFGDRTELGLLLL